MSLLCRGYDVQTENLNYYTGSDGTTHIGRIDFGWMLYHIASKKKVKLVSKRSYIGERTTPTNHYRDYFPFVKGRLPDAFAEISRRCKERSAEVRAAMEKSIENIVECAPEGKEDLAKLEALHNLAKHMGLQNWKHADLNDNCPLGEEVDFTDIEITDDMLRHIEEEVHSSLENSMLHRAQQMACIAEYIRYEIGIESLKSVPSRIRKVEEQHRSIKLLKWLSESEDFRLAGRNYINWDERKHTEYPSLVINLNFMNKILSSPMTEQQQEVVVDFISKCGASNKSVMQQLKKKQPDLYQQVIGKTKKLKKHTVRTVRNPENQWMEAYNEFDQLYKTAFDRGLSATPMDTLRQMKKVFQKLTAITSRSRGIRLDPSKVNALTYKQKRFNSVLEANDMSPVEDEQAIKSRPKIIPGSDRSGG